MHNVTRYRYRYLVLHLKISKQKHQKQASRSRWCLGSCVSQEKPSMKRKHSTRPLTKTKNPEPDKASMDWVIWAAWADRVTFEEIQEKTGLSESQVIALMRQTLKPASFKRWRKRARHVSIKHRMKFEAQRLALRQQPNLREYEKQLLSEED